MFEYLMRPASGELHPAVVAERPQRMRERWLFRRALADVARRAR